MPLDLTKLEGVQHRGTKTTARCPACASESGGGGDRSKDHLVIYSNGAYGCVIDRSEGHRKAIYALAGQHGSGDLSDVPTLAPTEPEPEVQLARTWSPDILALLVKDHSYWAGRGVSEATVEPFLGGVALKGQLRHRYCFPIFSDEGDIMGFDARWALPTPPPPPPGKTKGAKWKKLGDSRLFVWGGLDEIADCGRAVLVESIGDSLMLREHGVPESLCLFGVHMSEVVLAKLIELNPRDIVISTNRDSGLLPNGQVKRVGQDAALRIKRTLDLFFGEGVARILHPTENDWGCSSAEQIHAAFLAPPEAAGHEEGDPEGSTSLAGDPAEDALPEPDSSAED